MAAAAQNLKRLVRYLSAELQAATRETELKNSHERSAVIASDFNRLRSGAPGVFQQRPRLVDTIVKNLTVKTAQTKRLP